MKNYDHMTKAELISEINRLKKEYNSLFTNCEAWTKAFEEECGKRTEYRDGLCIAKIIIDNSPIIIFRRRIGDDHLIYVSQNIDQFGYSADDLLSGKLRYRDIVYEDDRPALKLAIKRHAQSNKDKYTRYYRIVTSDGKIRWVQDQASVVRDSMGKKLYNQGVIIDITKRRLAEYRLRESEQKFRRIVETAGEGIYIMNEKLIITDVNKTFCRLMGYTRKELMGKKPMDLADDEFRRFLLANYTECLTREYREFEGNFIAKDGRKIPVLIHGSILRNDEGDIIGHMAFITDMTEYKKGLILAGEVQKAFLPQTKPDIHGLDVAGKNISCDEIGGDYFDYFLPHETHQRPFSVVVGDITGHGVDAALLMTTARAFLRMRAARPGTIAHIVTDMNHHLTKDILHAGRFMTLFFMSIDLKNDSLCWVRAGHDPAILYDPYKDDYDMLSGQGIALGIDEDSFYKGNRRRGLKKGQIITIGTDGIWESRNKKGEMFGKKRLMEIIRKNADKQADNILNSVYDELECFTRGRRIEDDITLVIIKITDNP